MNSTAEGAPELCGYLEALRADHVPHSGRSLMEHLVGTYDILQSWGCGLPVCRAGMFHSIYGTNAFGFQCLDVQDRALVIRMVGEEAEQLIYLFCISHRPDAFIEAINLHVLRDRHTGQLISVDAATAHALVEIECANLIEQNKGVRFLRRFVDRFGASGRVTFEKKMLDEVTRHLDQCMTAMAGNA